MSSETSTEQLGLLGAVGGMIMDLLDVPDDNLTMPIVAGALMTLATR